ncbi:MAG: hypothetical protein ACOC7S_00990 [Planctomycetota bacterium]
MPRELKELRAKAMLESECEYLGVADVTCPTCLGSGYLDRAAFEFCPVCCGFREVPEGVADWVRARLAAMREERRPEAAEPVLRVGAVRARSCATVRRVRLHLPRRHATTCVR